MWRAVPLPNMDQVIGPLVHVRVLVAAAQVLGTFGVAGGVGGWVALQQNQQSVTGAESELRSADAAFHAQLKKSLAEGTSDDRLSDLWIREANMVAQPQPRAAFVVDRAVITTISSRTGDIRRMTVDLQLREIDQEVALNQQLRDLLATMAGDLIAGRDAGLDTAAFDAAYQSALTDAGKEEIPRLAQTSLDTATAQDAALKVATAGKVASNIAMKAAVDDANYQRQRALSDLARAQAIPVLDIHDVAAAIADLEARFPGARSIDDFHNLAAGYAADARTLENLLYSRGNAYSLLASAQGELAKAQGAGADVTNDAAKLNDLANQLGAAANLAAIQAIDGQLSFLIRDLEGLYFEARSRPFVPAGAIDYGVPFYKQIYSLSCESAALQMALAYYGANTNQDTILGIIGVDNHPPSYDSSGTLVWGNPYNSFVGNPNGYENADSGSASGYGTYFPRIAAAAEYFLPGSVSTHQENVPTDTVFAAAHNRQPIIAWVAFAYQPHPMHYMRAWDGSNNSIMYGAPWEHAVTVAGWAPGYLLINNPHSHPEWIDAGTFAAAFGMFNNMAVILQKPAPAPPAPSPKPSPILP
jgi:uncharacterized protein YvpB